MIIDYCENIDLSERVLEAHPNELSAIGYLAEGLHFLYRQVNRIEEKVQEQLGPNVQTVFVGRPPPFEWIPLGLVACSFHWYAVSACNLTRLIGWLAYEEVSTEATAYVKKVMPEVRLWRNKIAAHFARTDPRAEDNFADLAASVMVPVGFDDDAFYTQPLSLALGGAGERSTTRSDMRWSLTHVHQQLCRRYWPHELER